MKTILITAYAVNPYKGSEDGMGWNFILQAATKNKVIAFTRKNNGIPIEKYKKEKNDERYSNIEFHYFDWPKWLIFWKKGPTLSLIYYYFWQLTLLVKILNSGLKYDIVHNLNFHNDWTPSFLWLTGKPMVWGPIGHHPKIENQFLKFYGKKALLNDRFLWLLKNTFWNLDPFLWLSKNRASHILCMNEGAAKKLKLRRSKYSICPSVASEDNGIYDLSKNNFTIISVGRFVPLKGFDIAIKSFAKFHHGVSQKEKESVRLNLIGTGPFKQKLIDLVDTLNIQKYVEFTNWIDREDLQKIYASSSAFLFPSYEGAGMVVAEAMSYALPILCWDNAGPGKFVASASKLKVSLSNSESNAIEKFANNLNLLYTDKHLYKEEQILSRKRFEDNFQWHLRGQHFDKIYANVSK